jgi:quercetin dioxygenase-like cupin family protein
MAESRHVFAAGQARVIDGEVGGRNVVVVPGELTDGRLESFEQTIEPGHGPPLHVHDGQDEVFYVLDGDVRFVVGDEQRRAGPGASAVIARGTPHAFQVDGDTPARLLVTFTPAGIEPFFRGAAQLTREQADRAALAALSEPCGMRIIGPAMAVNP